MSTGDAEEGAVIGDPKSRSKWRLPSDDESPDSTGMCFSYYFLTKRVKLLLLIIPIKHKKCLEKQTTSSVPLPAKDQLPAVIYKGIKKSSIPTTCCVLCDQSFTSWKDFFNHLTTSEPGINIFTCLKCSIGFLSVGGLRDHEKEYHPTSKYVQGSDTMVDIFAHVLVCGDCGVHTVLIGNPFGSVKSNYDAIKSHCPSKMRKLSLYGWSSLAREYLPKCSVPKALNIRIKFVPTVHDVPLKCSDCSFEYSNYQQIENHAVLKHSANCTYKTCKVCSKSFATDFTYDMHTYHSHTSERWFLLEFLSSYPNGAPLDAAGFKISDRLFCDLCARSVPILEFNKHDCAVSYTRRIEVNGSRVKCPSVVLNKVGVGLSSTESPLAASISKTFTKIAMITLKYMSTLEVDSVETMKNKEYWSCFCCESIFDKRNLFASHLAKVHRNFNPSNRVSSSGLTHESLVKYGKFVVVSSDGVCCPIKDCSGVFCSILAAEWHLKSKHGDDFISPSSLVDSTTEIVPSAPLLLQISATPPADPVLHEQPEQRKKTNRSVAISNVFSLANGASTSTTVAAATKSTRPPIVATSTNTGSQTVLLHPPPVPNMKPGIYTFVVLDKAIQGHNMVSDVKLGMFKSCEAFGGCDYFVNCEQVESLMKVSNNGQTKFAVGCIPANYKLPEGVKIPHLAAVVQQQQTNQSLASTVHHVASLPLPPPPQAVSSHWECPICSLQSSSVVFLRNHLKDKHSHLCYKCGSCFVSTEYERIHERSCSFTMPYNSSFFCRPCNITFSILKDYYFHLMDNHQADVSFDETNGQVYPSCTIIQAATATVVPRTIGAVRTTANEISVDKTPSSSVSNLQAANENDDITIIEENAGVKRKANDTSDDRPSSKRAATDDNLVKTNETICINGPTPPEVVLPNVNLETQTSLFFKFLLITYIYLFRFEFVCLLFLFLFCSL